MKKTFLLLALVCVLVLLAACGSKPAPTEPAPTEPTSSRDLQMLYQSGITAMGADAPVLFPVSDISELSPLFPGLEEISFRQVSGGLSPVTGARTRSFCLRLRTAPTCRRSWTFSRRPWTRAQPKVWERTPQSPPHGRTMPASRRMETISALPFS